jgi:UDP-glucose 4-epimerase
MSNVVLITGVSRFLGGHLAAQLAADPSVDRVIGIDTTPPRTDELPQLGRTEFVRADIRNPLIAKVVSQARVTTVVHAALLASPRSVGGRVSMQEMNVIGTMQLLSACQKSDDIERVVLRSTTAVYGCSASDPAVFTEDMHPGEGGQVGYAKDAVEVEGYVRGFARRRPDIAVSVLRMAEIIGPTIDSPLCRYLRRPLVPASLGFDPRLQVLHESDAIETLRLAAVSHRPGVVNVAGDGVLPLSQVIRRTGRIRVPVPGSVVGLAGAVMGNSGLAELTATEARYLTFGRAVDTTRLHTDFGYTPRHSTMAAIDSLADGQPLLSRFARARSGVGSRVRRAVT